jgi:protein transport protein SEC13
MPGDLLDYRELIKEFVQHDAVLDYYGRRLATCSSDKTIKIFDVDGENHKLTETLRGYSLFLQLTKLCTDRDSSHEGAVWCVAWVRIRKCLSSIGNEY